MQKLNNINELVELKGQEIIKNATKMMQTELDIFEFNLFLSSLGKKNLEKADKEVKELRKKIKTGKISLEEIDKIAEKF